MLLTAYWETLNRARTSAKSGNMEDAKLALNNLLTQSDSIPSEFFQDRYKLLREFSNVYGLDLSLEPQGELCDIDLDSYISDIKPGVSLVTCCMNRNENLVKALHSWIDSKEIDEIIIVDWSSEDSVYGYLIRCGIRDPRIKVIRVDNQPRWILSYAFNIGFRAAAYDKILKTDADIIIHEDFFTKNKLTDYIFLSGDWRIAEKGQEHINGFFYVTRENLLRQKGFNEYITTYGWDDDDIYNRLQAAGVKRTHIDVSSIYHIPHDDAQRLGNTANKVASALDELHRDTLFKIRTNRYISQVMPPWNEDRFFLPFKITNKHEGYLKLERSGETIHYVPPHVQSDAEYYAAAELVSWRLGLRVFDLEKKKLIRLLKSKMLDAINLLDIELALHNEVIQYPEHSGYLVVEMAVETIASDGKELLAAIENIAKQASRNKLALVILANSRELLDQVVSQKLSYGFIPLWRNIGLQKEIQLSDVGKQAGSLEGENFRLTLDSPNALLASHDKNAFPIRSVPIIRKSKLYIDAQHGLGNRLRAIASAAAIAEASERELVIVWQPDHHCDCKFSDLFDYHGSVIENSFVFDAYEKNYSVFNYMEIEEGSDKDSEINLVQNVDAYARSAYALNSTLTSWDKENVFLQALKPVEEVQSILSKFKLENNIGVHVRMEAGKGLDQNSYDNLDNWTEDGHEQLHFWREKSHYSNFIKRIDQLITKDNELQIFLATDLPETYAVFEQQYGDRLKYLSRNVYDRSREQNIYALSDMILLSRCNGLLGSTWSSFSELAMRLSINYSSIEMSGKDF